MFEVHKPGDGQGGILSRLARRLRGDSKPWSIIERVLLVGGLLLLGFYVAARIESFLGSRAALNRFAAAVEPALSSSDASRAEGPASPDVDTSLWDVERVRAYEERSTMDPQAPLAVLDIPKIRLAVPVLDGTDDLTLNHAVGRIRGTARPGEPGNIGIAGHRDGFFRGLKDVHVGDRIDLKTPRGTDSYVVVEIQIVSPDDVGVLQPRTAPSLTLVTCYPFYFVGSAPQRYIVTASLAPEGKRGSGNLNLDPRSQNTQYNEEEQ